MRTEAEMRAELKSLQEQILEMKECPIHHVEHEGVVASLMAAYIQIKWVLGAKSCVSDALREIDEEEREKEYEIKIKVRHE